MQWAIVRELPTGKGYADVVFVPIGGKYTMDAAEAAGYINKKQPGLVVPIHYKDPAVSENFNKLIIGETKVKMFNLLK